MTKEQQFTKYVLATKKTLGLCFNDVVVTDKSWEAFHVVHFRVNGRYTLSISMERSSFYQRVEFAAWNTYDLDIFDRPAKPIYDQKTYRELLKYFIDYVLMVS